MPYATFSLVLTGCLAAGGVLLPLLREAEAYDGAVLNWKKQQVANFFWAPHPENGQPMVSLDSALDGVCVDDIAVRKSKPRGWYFVVSPKEMERNVPAHKRVLFLRINGTLECDGKEVGTYAWIPDESSEPYPTRVNATIDERGKFPATGGAYWAVGGPDSRSGDFHIEMKLLPHADPAQNDKAVLRPWIPPIVVKKYLYAGIVVIERSTETQNGPQKWWSEVGTFHWAGRRHPRPSADTDAKMTGTYHGGGQLKVLVTFLDDDKESTFIVERSVAGQPSYALDLIPTDPYWSGTTRRIKANGAVRYVDGASDISRMVGEYRWYEGNKVWANFDIELVQKVKPRANRLALPDDECDYEVEGPDFPVHGLSESDQWYIRVKPLDSEDFIPLLLQPELPVELAEDMPSALIIQE